MKNNRPDYLEETCRHVLQNRLMGSNIIMYLDRRDFRLLDLLQEVKMMRPIKFQEANRNLLKPDSMTDDECSPLWVYTDGDECISCWELSLKDRLNALIHGRIWLSVLSGRTQPPVWIQCDKTVFSKVRGD